jgi:hypothetical protein
MNILLVGDRQNSRGLLQLLLEKSKHRLERKSLESFPEPDLEAYDMVLVDGKYTAAPSRQTCCSGSGRQGGVFLICR